MNLRRHPERDRASQSPTRGDEMQTVRDSIQALENRLRALRLEARQVEDELARKRALLDQAEGNRAGATEPGQPLSQGSTHTVPAFEEREGPRGPSPLARRPSGVLRTMRSVAGRAMFFLQPKRFAGALRPHRSSALAPTEVSGDPLSRVGYGEAKPRRTPLRMVRRVRNLAAVSGGWMALSRNIRLVLEREGVKGMKRRFERFMQESSAIMNAAGDLLVPTPEQLTAPPLVEIGAGGLDELVAGLRFQNHEKPLVSIVIPVFNQLEYTVCCLASISKHAPRHSFEIIVMDDASSDATPSVLSSIANVRYARNAENLGFIRTCNQGAFLARGEYVLFLNNDTQVLDGWLDELLKAFETVPDAGLVGAKLIFPNGRLQEAGCLVNATGAAEHIGRRDDPNKHEYNHLREVDYCSGACLLISKALFTELGGFDESFMPAYYEDSDLAFRVRKAGRKVLYQPHSVIVHHMSVTTNGTDVDKRLQLAKVNQGKFVERWKDDLERDSKIRLIAFYLPQYHPIPENDLWWGKGFTEWTNVAKARPNFEGHYQPHIPADLGFYDLRLPEARHEQAMLARHYGVYGFCYYYYWFGGKRLLNRPLDEVLKTGEPDLPFCVCWANENWTRRWDGQESRILIAQRHSRADDIHFINSLLPAFRDERYIRVYGKPLLIVYRLNLLPNPKETAMRWREQCLKAGIGDIYLASMQSFNTLADGDDPKLYGFDAAVEFPPHGMGVVADPPSPLSNLDFHGLIYDYVATARNFINKKIPPYPMFRSVMPSWDNTARRQDAGHIFINATPEHYRHWLSEILDKTRKFNRGDERLVFVNAWNEWGEGNHLEPDRKYGHGFLEATRDALLAASRELQGYQ
jgi:GT2 family glycosyltransferase